MARPCTMLTPSTESVSTNKRLSVLGVGVGVVAFALLPCTGLLTSKPSSRALSVTRLCSSRRTARCTPSEPCRKKVPKCVTLSTNPFFPASSTGDIFCWLSLLACDVVKGVPHLVQNFCPALVIIFPHLGHCIAYILLIRLIVSLTELLKLTALYSLSSPEAATGWFSVKAVSQCGQLYA